MEEYIDDFIDRFRSDDRILELSSFAEKYDLQFVKRDRLGNQDHRLLGFEIFKGKRGKRLRGIILDPEPTLPCTGRIYDYQYYGDGGKRKTTIIEIRSEQINVPKFIIKPKKGMYRIKDMFVKTRPLIRDAQFNEHYVIESEDDTWMAEHIQEDQLDVILSRNKVTIEGNKNYLLIYYRNKRIDIAKLIKDYEFALDFFEAITAGGSDRYV